MKINKKDVLSDYYEETFTEEWPDLNEEERIKAKKRETKWQYKLESLRYD